MISRLRNGAIFGLSLLSTISVAKSTEDFCSESDFQACRSCESLEKAVNYSEPSLGDYYKGAEWNGLYSAYVLNCQAIGRKLLEAGASPEIGGSYGSMLYSVSSKWPHNDVRINKAWAKMLLEFEPDISKSLPGANSQSTAELMYSGELIDVDSTSPRFQ